MPTATLKAMTARRRVAAHPAAVLDVIPPTIAVGVPVPTRRRRWGVSDVGVRPR